MLDRCVYQEEIKIYLWSKFHAVKIEFDERDNPTLIFNDGVSQKYKKRVVDWVETFYKRRGGEVVFNLELERIRE